MNLYEIYSIFSQPYFIVLTIIAGLCGLIDIIAHWGSIDQPHQNHSLSDALLVNLSFSGRKITLIFINLFLVFAVLFFNNHFVVSLGCSDLRVMPKGTYCYYVLVTNEKDKTYTLPAKIEKLSYDEYYIDNVYFKNGGWLYFEGGDYFQYDDTSYSSFDQNGKEWDLELTSKKATHAKVTEVKIFTLSTTIFYYALSFEFLFIAIMHLIHLTKGYKQNR